MRSAGHTVEIERRFGGRGTEWELCANDLDAKMTGMVEDLATFCQNHDPEVHHLHFDTGPCAAGGDGRFYISVALPEGTPREVAGDVAACLASNDREALVRALGLAVRVSAANRAGTPVRHLAEGATPAEQRAERSGCAADLLERAGEPALAAAIRGADPPVHRALVAVRERMRDPALDYAKRAYLEFSRDTLGLLLVCLEGSAA